MYFILTKTVSHGCTLKKNNTQKQQKSTIKHR